MFSRLNHKSRAKKDWRAETRRPRREESRENTENRRKRNPSPTCSSTPHPRKRNTGGRSAYFDPGRHEELSSPESKASDGEYWKPKSRVFKNKEDDLYRPYDVEDTDPFTYRIRTFEFPKRTKMPSNVKTYDGTSDPEDHLKSFCTAAKVERSAMPTWCHMFNSTLMGHARVWFDELPAESIDNFEALRKSFLSYFLQQKKYAKDPVELHHIKQREGEPTGVFVECFKTESMHVKGALECMKISGFMHGITNPELIKRLNDKIPQTVDEMWKATTAFLRRTTAAANQSKRKQDRPTWKNQENGSKGAQSNQAFERKSDFKERSRADRRRPDRFTLLTKTPKEILAMDSVKLTAPQPMASPVESRNKEKYCDFHRERGHTTDECFQLKKQIEEAVRSGQLAHQVKEIKNGSQKGGTTKGGKKEAPVKDKAPTIFMVQSWQRNVRQKIPAQTSPNMEISFPPVQGDDWDDHPLVVKAVVGEHRIHRMYVDNGSASEVLYEHCFNRLNPKVKKRMIPATTPLLGFSGEISWPLGQILLEVTLGDEENSASTWMNFMVVRSPSPYNGIIGRPGIRLLKIIPSTAHGMIKFPTAGGIVTLHSDKTIPVECRMVTESQAQQNTEPAAAEGIKVAIHPEFPDQTITIGGSLTSQGKKDLCELLRSNLDIFAWKPSDMTGVPRNIAEHKLNIREGYTPVRQKKRGQAPERNKAINDDVAKLVEAGIMREVHYHDWLSNPVLVKKSDGSWRICVDFKDLNKACPKDCNPLP